MDQTTLVGVIGASLLLVAFTASQLKKLQTTDLTYIVLNFLGATGLTIYAILLKSYPFVVLESLWAIVSLKDIFLGFCKKNK